MRFFAKVMLYQLDLLRSGIYWAAFSAGPAALIHFVVAALLRPGQMDRVSIETGVLFAAGLPAFYCGLPFLRLLVRAAGLRFDGGEDEEVVTPITVKAAVRILYACFSLLAGAALLLILMPTYFITAVIWASLGGDLLAVWTLWFSLARKPATARILRHRLRAAGTEIRMSIPHIRLRRAVTQHPTTSR